MLENNEVEMVIYDESLLRYVDKVNQYEIQPLRPIIQNYGIAFSSGFELKDDIDVIILQMIEDGTYQSIYDKWFKK
jgi:ABC-type amino acid transport substrate-binding protein